MEKMQALDHKFNKTKIGYQLEMEKDYSRMTDELILQCKTLTKQKEFVCATLKQEQGKKKKKKLMIERYLLVFFILEGKKFINEKVRLNIGGNMFEVSISFCV